MGRRQRIGKIEEITDKETILKDILAIVYRNIF